jgi:predicted alternative tryptophan synthase beta-subunit
MAWADATGGKLEKKEARQEGVEVVVGETGRGGGGGEERLVCTLQGIHFAIYLLRSENMHWSPK